MGTFITNTGEAVAFACFILTKRYDEAVQQLFLIKAVQDFKSLFQTSVRYRCHHRNQNSSQAAQAVHSDYV